MKKLFKVMLFSIIWIQFTSSLIEAQLILNDDFQYKNEYWFWRADGNQSEPLVKEGLLQLKLQNATDTEYCNTEIYDPSEPYQPGTQVRVRLKNSNIHFGSRGWGFWDGKADTLSLIFDFDVAWVMQQGSPIDNPVYNWFSFGVAGNLIINRQSIDLNQIVDETKWHTYKIIWGLNNVSFYVDDEFIYESLKQLPDNDMRMDIWIDNRVISLANPSRNFLNNVEDSEMLVDFVEISSDNGPSISREIKPNVLIWDSPNTFPNGEVETLWKNYNFTTSSSGEVLLFFTGSAESYGNILDDDDIKIVIDGHDFGWDTDNSLDGNILNGKGKSIVLPVELEAGEHNLEIYSDITPFLRDAIVIFSENGQLIHSTNFDEIADESDGIWKTIEFNTESSSETTVIISGTADGNSGIRFQLDNNNFGWEGDEAINGETLQGLPNTVIINEILDAGTHQLKIHKKGNPQLYSVAIYAGTSITDVEYDETVSETIYLRANPNPFNISTNINYKTQNSSYNNVKIVNVLGQKVETLVDEYQQKGEYNLVWNANKETSGIYFIILESDKYFKVEKLLLLK